MNVLLALGCCCQCLSLEAGTRASAGYSVSADTLDSGGSHSASAAYINDASLGGIGGVSTAASVAEVAKHGYAGQLFDLTQLVLAAVPSSIPGGGASQIQGQALLDDGSWLELSGADIQWGPPLFPVVSISSSGLVTASFPTASTTGSVSGNFRELAALVKIDILVASSGAPTLEVSTPANTPLVLSETKFLALAGSPDFSPRTLVGLGTPSAGEAAAGARTITYTPANGYVGIDSFIYTVSDASGVNASGSVRVTVGDPGAVSPNLLSIQSNDAGVLLQFAGIPGRNYVIQWAPAAGGPWTDFADGAVTAGVTGLIPYTDTTSPRPSARFYRTRVAP